MIRIIIQKTPLVMNQARARLVKRDETMAMNQLIGETPISSNSTAVNMATNGHKDTAIRMTVWRLLRAIC